MSIMANPQHMINLFESFQSIPEDIREDLIKIAQYGWTPEQVMRAYKTVREHLGGARSTETSNRTTMEYMVELPARPLAYSGPVTPNINGTGPGSHATVSESPYCPDAHRTVNRLDEAQQTPPIKDSNLPFFSPVSTVSYSESVPTPNLPASKYPSKVWSDPSPQEQLQHMGTWDPDWWPMLNGEIGLGINQPSFSPASFSHSRTNSNANATSMPMQTNELSLPPRNGNGPSTDIHSPPYTPGTSERPKKRRLTVQDEINRITAVQPRAAAKTNRRAKPKASTPSPRTRQHPAQHSMFHQPSAMAQQWSTSQFSPQLNVQPSPNQQQMPVFTSTSPFQVPITTSAQDPYFHSGYVQQYPPSSS